MSDSASYNQIWNLMLGKIKQNEDYSDTLMNLWFRDLRPVMITDNSAVLEIKSDFKRDILNSKYKDKIERAFADVLGFPVTVDIRSVEKSENEVKTLTGKNPADEPGFYTKVGDTKAVNRADAYINRSGSVEYTFDNFVVGGSNEFAHAAAVAVANNPAAVNNPLFIHGRSGLGKTHLLYAITDRISKTRPELKIVYVKGEEFTNQMIDAISRNITAKFRETYRTADVLLIDDIQFIAGKESTQEEFFHTFNELYEHGKQIILTSDRPPKDIKTLEERLSSRFEMGLLADIKPPDIELRTAILKKKAEAIGIELPPDVLSYIADNLKSNVRQLEGAVKKVAAQSMLTGAPINLDLTIKCISDMIVASEPVSVTVEKILDCVSRHYGISVDEIKGKKRAAEIVLPRHIAIYLIRSMTDMSLPAIGKIFNRDHTTILNSLDAVENKLKTKPETENEINGLISEIRR